MPEKYPEETVKQYLEAYSKDVMQVPCPGCGHVDFHTETSSWDDMCIETGPDDMDKEYYVAHFSCFECGERWRMTWLMTPVNIEPLD